MSIKMAFTFGKYPLISSCDPLTYEIQLPSCRRNVQKSMLILKVSLHRLDASIFSYLYYHYIGFNLNFLMRRWSVSGSSTEKSDEGAVSWSLLFSLVDPDFIRLFFRRVNQALFSGSSNMDTYASTREVKMLNFPSNDVSEAQGTEDPKKTHAFHPESTDFSSLSVQIPNLVTLSLLPRSQWQSLTKLDIIKVHPPFGINFLAIHRGL